MNHYYYFNNKLSTCLAKLDRKTRTQLRNLPLCEKTFKEIVELISMETEHAAMREESSAGIINVLLKNDCAALVPLAAERHYHASTRLSAEISSQKLAQLSPIDHVNNKTIFAAPIGNLDDESLILFCDRLLDALLRTKKKKVILSLSNLHPTPNSKKIIAELEHDLKQQRITVCKRPSIFR